MSLTLGKRRQYAVDPLRESGLLQNQSNSGMYAAALAHPELYHQLRVSVEKTVTHDLVTKLYDVIYLALVDGKAPDGKADLISCSNAPYDALKQFIGTSARDSYEPNVPENEVNKIAFECATSLIRDLQERVVNKLMPVDLSRLANERIASKTTMRLSGGN